MILDELCESFDEMGISGDTPMRFKIDGEFYDVGAIQTEHDGSVTIILEDF